MDRDTFARGVSLSCKIRVRIFIFTSFTSFILFVYDNTRAHESNNRKSLVF